MSTINYSDSNTIPGDSTRYNSASETTTGNNPDQAPAPAPEHCQDFSDPKSPSDGKDPELKPEPESDGEYEDDEDALRESLADKWLEENAHRYGKQARFQQLKYREMSGAVEFHLRFGHFP